MPGGKVFVFYDLIMPMFFFLVGISMPIAFQKRLEKNNNKLKLYGHILKRVVMLYLFGMIVQGRLLTFDFHRMIFF